MAKTKSAAKRARIAGLRAQRNASVKSMVKTAVKKYETELAQGDASAAEPLLAKAISTIDKAAKRGVIHKKQADRRKSRLTHKLATLTREARAGDQDLV